MCMLTSCWAAAKLNTIQALSTLLYGSSTQMLMLANASESMHMQQAVITNGACCYSSHSLSVLPDVKAQDGGALGRLGDSGAHQGVVLYVWVCASM